MPVGSRYIISVYIILIVVFLIPNITEAQPITLKDVSNNADTSKTEKRPDSNIILEPVVDEYLYYDSSTEVYQVQNGIFFGRSHFGIETSIIQSGSEYFGSFFLGVVSSGETGLSNNKDYAVGGLSYGKEFLLYGNREAYNGNSPQIYFRAGPGIGLAGRGVLTGSDSEYYFGVHTTLMLGAEFSLTDRTSLFMNGGGRVLWFPALNEIGLMNVPVISLGIQFSTSPGIPMLRY